MSMRRRSPPAGRRGGDILWVAGTISGHRRNGLALWLVCRPLEPHDHLRLICGFLPDGALEVIGDRVKRIAAHGHATLGFAFLGTLALSLWGANAGTKSERETRGFIKLTLWSLTFTIGAVGLALLSLVGIIAVPLALNFLGLSQQLDAKLLAFLRWPLLYRVVLFGLACPLSLWP
jgi:membrane protein